MTSSVLYHDKIICANVWYEELRINTLIIFYKFSKNHLSEFFFFFHFPLNNLSKIIIKYMNIIKYLGSYNIQ